MRQKLNRAQKVLHPKRRGRRTGAKPDGMQRLRLLMFFVAAAALVVAGAFGVVAWLLLREAPEDAFAAQNDSVQVGVGLPVYEDSFNLVLVNKNRRLDSGFIVNLTEFDGVQVEERILPALRKMLEDAKQDGCELRLTEGFVDCDTQQQRYLAQVERLMRLQGYTGVRAQEEAKNFVLPGDYSELQTGLAVQLACANGDREAFSATKEFRWLEKNSVSYGFVLRYPALKVTATGHVASDTQFRYVGAEHAAKMRSLGMALEEYWSYVQVG